MKLRMKLKAEVRRHEWNLFANESMSKEIEVIRKAKKELLLEQPAAGNAGLSWMNPNEMRWFDWIN